MAMQGLGLVADIGATNTRLALVEPGGAVTRVRVSATDELPDLADIIESYLADEAGNTRPAAAVLAIAAPVTGDEVTLTNFPWTFSIHELRERLEPANSCASSTTSSPTPTPCRISAPPTAPRSAAVRRCRERRLACSGPAPASASAPSCRARVAR